MPYAPAPGARLHYESTGSGSPIVFVHETAADLRSWESQVRWFSRFPLSWRTGATFVHDTVFLGLVVSIAGHIMIATRDSEALGGMTRGTVSVETRVTNQNGVRVMTFRRTALVPKRNHATLGEGKLP